MPMGDGGFSARETSKSASESIMMTRAIRDGFNSIPTPKLSIVEFQSVQDSRNRSINISEA
jgi:hypothetical protein